MKKFWTILLALVFAAAFCAYAQAGILDGYQELLKAVEKAAAPEMITSGNYEYYVSEETAVIANYFGDEESLVIPAQIDGYEVTGIGDGAFSYLEMKSVSFPESVRSIGKRAFEYCTITDQLNLPDNITIGEDAFSYAAFSSPVVIPAGATVEKCAFSYCRGLQQVEIGPGALIRSRAFGYCDDLEQVVCAEDTLVEEDAFEYCPNLEKDTSAPAPGSEQPGSDEGKSYDEAITKAIDLIRDAWQAEADEYPQVMEKPYVDIKNTRIIEIADKPVNADMENKPVDELKDVDYIIEFMMLTNYFGDSLPINAGILDTVAVYRNGKMEVQKSNLMNALRAKYYMTDYSGVIDEIIDLGDAYSGQIFE